MSIAHHFTLVLRSKQQRENLRAIFGLFRSTLNYFRAIFTPFRATLNMFRAKIELLRATLKIVTKISK